MNILNLLSSASLLAAAAVLSAQQSAPPAKDPLAPPNDGHHVVPLWPAGAPGALGGGEFDIPGLTSYLPASNPTHTAVLVAPGGGYKILARDHEGAQVGVWLAQHGIAAFVLNYRLGPRYHYPIQLEDAQRALRTIRAQADRFGYSKDHIGMWGFSAGGHLTATAATKYDGGNSRATDPIDRESSRPNFIILGYPVISLEPGLTHSGSLNALLGDHPTQQLIDMLSADQHVTPETPPAFIFSTTDDPAVPIMNSVLFYSALVKNNVPAEMHLFRHGRHGVGLGGEDHDLSIWPTLLANWLVSSGWAKAGFTTTVLPPQ